MVRTEGWRTGPPDVLTRLLDPVEGDKVDPGEYRFRIFVRFETGDERYRWVNEGMWIGSGIRRGLAGKRAFCVIKTLCFSLLLFPCVATYLCPVQENACVESFGHWRPMFADIGCSHLRWVSSALNTLLITGSVCRSGHWCIWYFRNITPRVTEQSYQVVVPGCCSVARTHNLG